MRKIRIGNTVDIRWKIFAGEGEEKAPYDLTGKDLTIYMLNAFGETQVEEFATEGNMILFSFEGKDQRYAGTYQLTLIENEGKADMRTIDDYAFELVRCSCTEDDAYVGFDNTISISSQLNVLKIYPVVPEIGDNGNWIVDGKDTGKPSISYGGVAIDSELSENSSNAIQNKAVAKAIKDLKPVVADFTIEDIYSHILEKTVFNAGQGIGDVICDAIRQGRTVLIPYDYSGRDGYAIATGGLESSLLVLRITLKDEIITAYFDVNNFRNGTILALDSTISNILFYNADENPTGYSVPLRNTDGSISFYNLIDNEGFSWATTTSSHDAKRNADRLFQEMLVDGVNIKTINGQSILGEGDLSLESGGGSYEWPFYLIDQNWNDTVYLEPTIVHYAMAGEGTGDWSFDLARNWDASDVGKQWRLIVGTEKESGASVSLYATDVIWENGEPDFNGGYYDITFICVETYVILAKYTRYNR